MPSSRETSREMLEVVDEVLAAASATSQDNAVLPAGGLDVELLQTLCGETFDTSVALERLMTDARSD